MQLSRRLPWTLSALFAAGWLATTAAADDKSPPNRLRLGGKPAESIEPSTLRPARSPASLKSVEESERDEGPGAASPIPVVPSDLHVKTQTPTVAPAKPKTTETKSKVAESKLAAARPVVKSVDAKPKSDPKMESLVFNGAQLGVSTRADVANAWGEPKTVSKKDAHEQHTYSMPPFDHIEATFFKGKLFSVVIHLRQSFSPKELAEQLRLSDIESVPVPNARGAIVGEAYPERGVAFSYRSKEKQPQVSQIILDCLDSEPFVMRAEKRAGSNYAGCLSDLDKALTIDPKSTTALGLKSRILKELGQEDEALATINEALAIEPRNPEFLLLKASILGHFGEYQPALQMTELAIKQCANRPITKARAVSQLGDLIAEGPKHNYQVSLDYHQQAIKIAEPHLADTSDAVRREARDVLVAAHLGAANDVAWGRWKTKQTVAPRWIERALQIADQTASTPADAEKLARLISRRALWACVGLQGQLDPTEWVDALSNATQQRLQSVHDPLTREHLARELALALDDAMQAYQLRGDTAAALDCGNLAVTCFERSESTAQADVASLARLYFRIGSIYAVQQKDHVQAVAWFDKALPTLQKPLAPRHSAEMGKQGESLVSMGVSYWALGKQEKALELSRVGVEWIEQAVEDGFLEKQSLSVPYANLATIHRHLGHEDRSRSFMEMAERLDNPKLR